MGVQLRIGIVQRNFVVHGVTCPVRIGAVDLCRRSGRVVMEGHPRNRAGLDAGPPSLASSDEADPLFDISHRGVHRVTVCREDHGTLGLGRRQRPGDRDAFVG